MLLCSNAYLLSLKCTAVFEIVYADVTRYTTISTLLVSTHCFTEWKFRTHQMYSQTLCFVILVNWLGIFSNNGFGYTFDCNSSTPRNDGISQAPGETSTVWWKTSIIYQIYPRSFQDSDGDGVGDLKGITRRLDYIAALNVKAIWISPIYESPMRDFGYDISNQTRIEPLFGTMYDFKELVRQTRRRDIKLILDYIPNHTSELHPWFRESRRSNCTCNQFRDYYVWHDGVKLANGTWAAPNNWKSVFSGSAWTWDSSRQQFYLHQFLSEMPDLNWRCPKVKEEMENVVRFWLEAGADGFRVDAIQTLFESADVLKNEPRSFRPDKQENDHDYLRHIYTKYQEETHNAMTSMRRIVDEYSQRDGRDRFVVSEVYDEDINEIIKFYLSGSHMTFYFDLLLITRSCGGRCIYKTVDRLLSNLPPGTWPNFVLGNHDRNRLASKMGREFVNALNMLLLLLPGTPTTYQGEEIGMEDVNVTFEQTLDPFGRLYGPDRYTEVSRDPERSPMQWTDGWQAGFTAGKGGWLPIHSNYKTVNVQVQNSTTDTSVLKLYISLAHLRDHPSFQCGAMNYGIVNKNIFSFIRKANTSPAFLVILNFGKAESTNNYSRVAGSTSGEIVLSTQNFLGTDYDPGQVIGLDRITLVPSQGLVLKLV